MTSNGIINNMHNHCGSSCNIIKCWKWDILPLLDQCKYQPKYAVIVLNRPISQNKDLIKDLWNNATVRMTIDGGTLQWDTFLTKFPQDVSVSIKLPDFVTGDFDSITDDILQKYKKKGCKVIHTPDQNFTDFTKGVMELNKHCQQHETQMEHVIVIGQTSGRIDQILGNIQTLFLVKEKHLLSSDTKMYLLSDDSLSWLLSPGDHVISIPEETRKHKKTWCSLVPIGEMCESVTTSGLKWNLDESTLKFGNIVSTSNSFNGSDEVKIKCSHTILWSMRIPSLKS